MDIIMTQTKNLTLKRMTSCLNRPEPFQKYCRYAHRSEAFSADLWKKHTKL